MSIDRESLNCLKEIRDACAACFRIIGKYELARELEDELLEAGIKKGFGVRFQELIKKLEEDL